MCDRDSRVSDVRKRVAELSMGTAIAELVMGERGSRVSDGEKG